MAARAASQPLLPILVPARSTACSRVSAVMTPKVTGTPEAIAVWAIPLATSAASRSKCGVPPRTSAPTQMTAS